MTVLQAYPWVGERFGEARAEQNGQFVNTPCPLKCHRSAVVRWWTHEGVLCFKCFAGCDKLEILRAAGLSWRDCWPPDTDWRTFRPKQEVTAYYSYRDEAGDLLYQTLRLEPGHRGKDKEFRQRRQVGGAWQWSLGDVRRVLYRLPEIVARPGEPVVVVAGEKDADSLKKVGLLATTNVCGERSEWLDSYSESLAGRDVTVIEDQDSAGKRHAHEVVGSLLAHGVTGLRRCTLPGAKDATAYLNQLRRAGVTGPADLRAELLAVLSPVRRWVPAA